MIYAYREGISLPPSIFPVGYLFNYLRNQKIGHMVVYGTPRLTLKERIEHTCVHGCRHAPVDPVTGHVVGFWCGKITPESGLRVCVICEREYIDKDNYQDPDYETNCPECVSKYELDD